MYITKWIEGEKNLNDFCLKRFHEEPRFIGGIGKFLGTPAKVYKKEKYREDKQCYVQMFLLFMQDAKGKVCDIDNPSDRKHPSNGRFCQRMEINVGGTTNTLTSVGKDNMVLIVYD